MFWQYFFLLKDSSYILVFIRFSTVKHSIDPTTIQSHVPAIKEKCKVKYQVQQAQNQQQPYNQQADNEKMRFTLKKIFFVFLTLLIILIGYLLLQSVDLQRIRELLHDSEKFDLESLKQASLEIRKEIHYTNYLFSGYDNFTQQFSDEETLKQTSLNDKCKLVFTQWKESHPDFEFKTFEPEYERYDKSSDRKELFFKERINQLRKRFEKDSNNKNKQFTLSRQDNKTISQEYMEHVNRSKNVLQFMADFVSMMRLYGKCFFGRELDDELKSIYNEFRGKLFPFISSQAPKFRKSGETEEFGWPIYDNENNIIDRKTEFGDNPIEFLQKNSKGKGIVISVSTRYAKDAMRLIKILRALNNRLPIQIIYKNDITKKNIELLEFAAVATPEELFDPETIRDGAKFMPELNLLEHYKNYGSEFPIQDLTFVNIAGCVSRPYRFSFPGYSNKILAMLYSSFEEIILFDADVVLTVNPQEFFDSKYYKSSGTYFFQDRSLRDFNDFIETNFFSTLFPSNEKSIETIFDIPRVGEKTFSNKYMTGWRHYQEAGVVAYNKMQHFLGILMMFPLALWSEPVQSSIWGDKEMYWLGLSMAGDENYEFNKYAAASVGEKTTEQKYKYYPNSDSNEVCSTHPGHIDDNGRLLWINSGFSYCKKNGYFRDKGKFPFSTFELNDLVELYNSPIKIRAGLVPPDLPNQREPGSPPDTKPEMEFRKSWKSRKKDTDEINEKLPEGQEPYDFISEWGPQKGWVKNGICSGYYYCAYDKITSYSSEKEFDTGTLFEFDTKSCELYDYLSKIWHTGGSKMKPKVKLETEKLATGSDKEQQKMQQQ